MSRTTGSPVVASSYDPADGRQKRRRVAPEASDGPILPPIGGNAKQAGFAERRHGDQLHGSDRGLCCTFVFMHLLDGTVSFTWLTSTLIHLGADIFFCRATRGSQPPRTQDKSDRVDRGASTSSGPISVSNAVTTVRSDGPRAPSESSYHQLTGSAGFFGNLRRKRSSGRGTLSFR